MHDKRHIALVDAHAKALGSDQQGEPILLKVLMALLQGGVPVGNPPGLDEHLATVAACQRLVSDRFSILPLREAAWSVSPSFSTFSFFCSVAWMVFDARFWITLMYLPLSPGF